MVDFDKVGVADHDVLVFVGPVSTSARPKASRVAAPSFSSNFVLTAMLLQLL